MKYFYLILIGLLVGISYLYFKTDTSSKEADAEDKSRIEVSTPSLSFSKNQGVRVLEIKLSE